MYRSGSSTTAAATTGPARQPRPTSSMPATRWNPKRRKAFSRVRIARVLTMSKSQTQIPKPKSEINPTSPNYLWIWGLGFGIWDLLSLANALFHPCGLTLQIPQEVELRAPHPRRSHDVDLRNRRRVQRKDALHPLTKRDLAHRKAGARAAAVHADNDPFEDLDSFLVALANLHVHADGVAGLHSRSIRQLLLFDQLYRAHDISPLDPLGPRSFRISASNSRSSSSSVACSIKSGRRSNVRSSAVLFRHRRTSA